MGIEEKAYSLAQKLWEDGWADTSKADSYKKYLDGIMPLITAEFSQPDVRETAGEAMARAKSEQVIMRKKIYKYFYDNPKDREGKEKSNEFLGEFEIEGDITGYDYEVIGIMNGRRYQIIGVEVSYLVDRYHAGIKNFVVPLGEAPKEPTQFEHEQIAKTVDCIVKVIAFRDNKMTASEIVSAKHLIRDMVWECHSALSNATIPDATIEATNDQLLLDIQVLLKALEPIAEVVKRIRDKESNVYGYSPKQAITSPHIRAAHQTYQTISKKYGVTNETKTT
jgi:hypothetical protein